MQDSRVLMTTNLDARLRAAVARHAARLGLSQAQVVSLIERFLEAPVRDCDVPLAEVQHRVKNEMQLLASVMRQRQATVDQPDKNRCDACIGQVTAIAQLNATIEVGSSGSEIDVGRQALRFAAAMRDAFGLETEAMRLDIRTERLFVTRRVARNLLLILNEAVTNALKHGLGAEAGTIEISLAAVSDEMAELTVRNRVTGSRPRGDAGRGQSLIDALAAEIGARIVRQADDIGFCLTCVFPGRQAPVTKSTVERSCQEQPQGRACHCADGQTR